MSDPKALAQKLWSYCNVLRDDGLSYGDYVEQLSYLLFLKMADIQDPAKLRRLIVELIDQERWMILDADVKGDAYEGLLQKNAEDTKSGAGQYFTPRPLIQAVVEVMRPEPGTTICDPACGTGGFLLAAHEHISRRRRRRTSSSTSCSTSRRC